MCAFVGCIKALAILQIMETRLSIDENGAKLRADIFARVLLLIMVFHVLCSDTQLFFSFFFFVPFSHMLLIHYDPYMSSGLTILHSV